MQSDALAQARLALLASNARHGLAASIVARSDGEIVLLVGDPAPPEWVDPWRHAFGDSKAVRDIYDWLEKQVLQPRILSQGRRHVGYFRPCSGLLAGFLYVGELPVLELEKRFENAAADLTEAVAALNGGD